MFRRCVVCSINAVLILAVLVCVCPQHSHKIPEISSSHSACHHNPSEQPAEHRSCDQCKQEALLASDTDYTCLIVSEHINLHADSFYITAPIYYLDLFIRSKAVPLQNIRMNC